MKKIIEQISFNFPSPEDGFLTTGTQKANLLFNTRTYLVGHMQYANGRDWREYVEGELGGLGVRIFNPYKKPFVKDVNEDEDARLSVAHCIEHGYFNDVAERMKRIRSYDLNLVDRSDFIIAHLLPEVASWGSAEEIVTAVRMKKPIFKHGGRKTQNATVDDGDASSSLHLRLNRGGC